MRVLVAAVGQRLPAWASAACDDYAKRLPAEWRFELRAIKAEPRDGRSADRLRAAEAQRLQGAIARGVRRIALDESGARLSTARLAQRLRAWQGDGRDLAFLIGGPDGLDSGLLAQADESLRLSDLTLPHALARVVLIEALYRAWSVDSGHPYHRA